MRRSARANHGIPRPVWCAPSTWPMGEEAEPQTKQVIAGAEHGRRRLGRYVHSERGGRVLRAGGVTGGAWATVQLSQLPSPQVP